MIGAAIEVHRELGPGLLESVYEGCLAHELTLRQVPFERQKELPVRYRGAYLDFGFRMDFLVANELVFELKSVDQLNDLHSAQLLSYLRLSGSPVGLLLNFRVAAMKAGIRRIVSNYAG